MKKIRLFLVAMLVCIVTKGVAHVKTIPDTQRDYYMYSWIQVRGANKANGEHCFVILISSGNGSNYKPSILKNEEGKSILFNSQMDGLNYLTLQDGNYSSQEQKQK